MPRDLLAQPLVALLAVAVLPVLGCEPAVPPNPTFEKDVGPIFAARCVRCHGETLMGDPGQRVPMSCHLNRLDDAGDCTPTGVMMRLCSRGALYCADMIPFRVSTKDDSRMPPPPADPLSDWAKEVVSRWADDPRP